MQRACPHDAISRVRRCAAACLTRAAARCTNAAMRPGYCAAPSPRALARQQRSCIPCAREPHDLRSSSPSMRSSQPRLLLGDPYYADLLKMPHVAPPADLESGRSPAAWFCNFSIHTYFPGFRSASYLPMALLIFLPCRVSLLRNSSLPHPAGSLAEDFHPIGLGDRCLVRSTCAHFCFQPALLNLSPDL